jgi:hypothetical protein
MSEEPAGRPRCETHQCLDLERKAERFQRARHLGIADECADGVVDEVGDANRDDARSDRGEK